MYVRPHLNFIDFRVAHSILRTHTTLDPSRSRPNESIYYWELGTRNAEVAPWTLDIHGDFQDTMVVVTTLDSGHAYMEILLHSSS
jgi:hypothetical protein